MKKYTKFKPKHKYKKKFITFVIMAKVKFTKSSHTYEGSEGKYRSVTNIVNSFKQEFDSNFWSEYKAYEALLPNFSYLKSEYKKNTGLTHKDYPFLEYLSNYVPKGLLMKEKRRIRSKWNNKGQRSSRKGTAYHDDREKTSYIRGTEINPRTNTEFVVHQKEHIDGDNSSWTANLFDLEDGFYPELLLWNDEYRIAGQADRVFIETCGPVRFIDIGDYKTNEKLTMESYYDWDTKTYQMMKPPVDHIQDCKFMHYSLQLSMYAWLLEQYGFQCRHLTLHHFNQMHEVEYLKQEIEDILAYIYK